MVEQKRAALMAISSFSMAELNLEMVEQKCATWLSGKF